MKFFGRIKMYLIKVVLTVKTAFKNLDLSKSKYDKYSSEFYDVLDDNLASVDKNVKTALYYKANHMHAFDAYQILNNLVNAAIFMVEEAYAIEDIKNKFAFGIEDLTQDLLIPKSRDTYFTRRHEVGVYFHNLHHTLNGDLKVNLQGSSNKRIYVKGILDLVMRGIKFNDLKPLYKAKDLMDSLGDTRLIKIHSTKPISSIDELSEKYNSSYENMMRRVS